MGRHGPLAPALRWLVEDEDVRQQLAASFYWTLQIQRLEEGTDGRTASRIALRQAQLVVLLLHGYSQRESASILKVSERTMKLDAQRIRGALPSVRAAAALDLPAVPCQPDDARVTPLEPPARGRTGSQHRRVGQRRRREHAERP